MSLWVFKYLVLIQALFQTVASVALFPTSHNIEYFPFCTPHHIIMTWLPFDPLSCSNGLFVHCIFCFALLFVLFFSIFSMIDSQHVLLRILPWPSKISCSHFYNHTDSDWFTWHAWSLPAFHSLHALSAHWPLSICWLSYCGHPTEIYIYNGGRPS